jgi:hypothetical protein
LDLGSELSLRRTLAAPVMRTDGVCAVPTGGADQRTALQQGYPGISYHGRPQGWSSAVADGAAERAENRIDEAGAACLAPVLVRLSKLKSLSLDSTLRASLALFPVTAVARGAVARALGDRAAFLFCCGFGKPGGTAASAAMCAGNYIRDAAAASLAPILVRMPQLTSLDLSCMLCIAGVGAKIHFPRAPTCCSGGVACGAVLGRLGQVCACRWNGDCVQTTGSAPLGRRTLHVVSWG